MHPGARRISPGPTYSRYPLYSSHPLRVRTLQGDDGLARTLAQRFCDIVGDARLTEIGVYEHGAEAWLVFATPFTPLDSVDPAELDRRVLELINEARRQGRRCGSKALVAAGQTTAWEVVGTWLSSAGHCENLMCPDYTETGVAYALRRSSDKGTYWVEIFGKPK